MKLFKSFHHGKLILWFLTEQQLEYLKKQKYHMANLGNSFHPVINDNDDFVCSIVRLADIKTMKLELFAIGEDKRDKSINVQIMELE